MRDLLVSGRFGPVQLGMKRREVLSLLGPPHATNEARRQPRHPILWSYGGAWLWFEERPGVLERVGAEYFPNISYVDTSGVPRDFVDHWILNGDLTLEEAERELRAAGLGFEKSAQDVEDGVSLRFESGAWLAFSREWSRDLLLCGCWLRRL